MTRFTRTVNIHIKFMHIKALNKDQCVTLKHHKNSIQEKKLTKKPQQLKYKYHKKKPPFGGLRFI